MYDVDLGLPRFGPLSEALAKYPLHSLDPVEAVLSLAGDLKMVCQQVNPSAASKFLWFAWGQDIVIHDSYTLRSMRHE